jgi:hypothetical protein
VGSGLNGPVGVALDAAGNIFVADGGDGATDGIIEIQRSQPPSFNFGTVNLSQNNASSPQSVTVENIGNRPLNALSPGLSVGANFTQVTGSGTPEDCTSSFSLEPGTGCNLSISFTPTANGSIQSAAVLTDNALDANPATQSITL